MQRLLIRIHGYLAVMTKFRELRITVQTLNVDLVRHIHHFCPPLDYKNTFLRLDRFLNPDDSIEDTRLLTALD